MRRSLFSDEQIIGISREAAARARGARGERAAGVSGERSSPTDAKSEFLIPAKRAWARGVVLWLSRKIGRRLNFATGRCSKYTPENENTIASLPLPMGERHPGSQSC